MQIHSFDVFDTVLVRRVGEPVGVYLLLATRLRDLGLIALNDADFQERRIAAEYFAARTAPADGGPRIQDIYRELALSLGWSERQRQTAMTTEFEIEKRTLCAIPDTLARIASARESAQMVIFISDMYWASTEIKSLLLHLGAAREEDRVFASADFGCGKISGALYRHAMEIVGRGCEPVRHIGNSWEADVAGAKRAGIRGEYYGHGNLNFREKRLLDDSRSIFAQHLSGTARICRLRHVPSCSSAHLNSLTGTVSAVVMPVLLMFALWVVREAAQRRLERLIFVSRDGWLLMKAVEKAMRISGHRAECIFVYGSRQAWHGAAVGADSLESCTWLFEGRATLSLRRLLGRLGLSQASTMAFAEQLKLPVVDDAVLTDEQIRKVRGWLQDALTSDGTLRAMLEKRKHAAISYLRQEGVIANSRAAIVDLGWAGRLQNSLNRLVEIEGGIALEGLFLGLAENAKSLPAPKAAFLFDHRERLCPLGKLPGLLQVLESFCTQRQGSVSDYIQNEDGRWCPVFQKREEPAVVEWGIDHVHRISESFLSEFPDDCEVSGEPSHILMRRARRIVSDFVDKPSKEEARAWGAFPFEHEQAGDATIPLAEPYPALWTALNHVITGNSGRPIGGYWQSASKVMSPLWQQLTVRTLVKGTMLLRRLG